MKCLLVTAHPLEDSLCHSFAAKIANQLRSQGHEVIEENLYQQGFNAQLTIAERQSYYKSFDGSEIENYIKRLQSADALILVFPTWWFGFPAILKGWFDRVWAPGVAFENAEDLGAIKPLLSDIKRVFAVTTLGSPWWIDHLIMHRPVKRILKHALLGACARNAKLEFLSLYKSEKLSAEIVEKFERKISLTLGSWT